MKLSALEECGLRCLVAIASRGPQGAMTIPELAEHENLSQPHIAKLMTIMRQAGLVRSTRGHIGGYQLAKPSQEMVIGEILTVLGGRVYDETFCSKHAGLGDECVHLNMNCRLKPLWTQVQDAIDGVLNRITLDQVVRGTSDAGTIELSSLEHRNGSMNGCCKNGSTLEPASKS